MQPQPQNPSKVQLNLMKLINTDKKAIVSPKTLLAKLLSGTKKTQHKIKE
jgi:hypothetical protein